MERHGEIDRWMDRETNGVRENTKNLPSPSDLDGAAVLFPAHAGVKVHPRKAVAIHGRASQR